MFLRVLVHMFTRKVNMKYPLISSNVISHTRVLPVREVLLVPLVQLACLADLVLKDPLALLERREHL